MRSYFRFLWNHKSLTAIQIVGISIAMSFAIPAVSLMVELWQMDHDNSRYKDIYGVKTAGTMSFAGEDKYIMDRYPEVEAASLFLSPGTNKNTDIIWGNTQYSARTMFCNADITDFFPVKMMSGSIESISEGKNIILSKEFAASLSDENLLGSTVFINDESYLVSGIMDEFESRRIPYTDIVLSMDDNIGGNEFFTYTFIRLKKGTDISTFEEKFKGNETEVFASKINVPEKVLKLGFERYDQMSVSSSFYWLTSMNPTMSLFVGLAVLLLLLFAFSNYATLSTAMSTRRAKEMATRRLLGVSKTEIFVRSLCENTVFSSICFMLGLLFASFSAEALNRLMSVDVPTSLLSALTFSPISFLAYAILIVVISLLTGIAPARAVTRYSALDIVKGEFRAKEKSFISKLLIVFQGMLTVALLFLSILEFTQFRHNLKMDFGCDIDDVYSVYLPSSDDAEKELVMHALRSKPYVLEAGYAQDIPGFCYNTGEVDNMYVNNLVCDQDAFRAFGFRISEDFASRGTSTLWISQQMKDEMNGDELSGEQMDILGTDVVGGTIEKFLCSTNLESGYSVVTMKSTGASIDKEYIVLRTSGDHRELSKDIRETVNSVILSNSDRPKSSRCTYVRDFYNKQNLAPVESLLGLMKEYLIIMLVLSLLGILGMSTYNMLIHKHDIAIRKVFGSSTMEETVRNTRSYSRLMLISNIIGLPLGFLLGNALLQSEVSKVAISPWMFIVTAMCTMAAVVFVCSVQSYIAATVNPVESIKSE